MIILLHSALWVLLPNTSPTHFQTKNGHDICQYSTVQFVYFTAIEECSKSETTTIFLKIRTSQTRALWCTIAVKYYKLGSPSCNGILEIVLL